jgi:hypothetical protein
MHKIENLKKEAFEIIHIFCVKYEMSYEFSVCGNPFDFSLISDFYFSFETIIYCLENDIESELLFQWYNDNLEHKDHINLQSYRKGLRHKDLINNIDLDL